MVITAADLDLEVGSGAFDCTHWIEVGGVAYSCDFAPEEHKPNTVGCTIHGAHVDVGHAVGIGAVVVHKSWGCDVLWTDSTSKDD